MWGAGLALWPSVAVAWGLRRRALPAARARWPRVGPWGEPALALATLALAAALVLAGAERRAAAGHALPRRVGGAADAALRGAAGAGGCWPSCTPCPLWLAGGVVLAALWPPRRPLVRRFVRRPAVGADGGRGPGHRKSEIALPVAVPLRPVPTQRIATATFGEDAWTVKPLYGPGLLAMIVAPPGVGKTEIAYGSLAAAVDGLAFCGLPTTQAPAGAAARARWSPRRSSRRCCAGASSPSPPGAVSWAPWSGSGCATPARTGPRGT